MALKRQRRKILPRSRRLRRHGAKGKFKLLRLACQRRRRRACLEKDRQEPAAQLQVVAVGLMGSGKSTLLRALLAILGGRWLNQDEFVGFQRHAKREFLNAIRTAASMSDGCFSPAVFVDKINTLRSHRREILDALDGEPGREIPARRRVLIRFVHPLDPQGCIGSHALQMCKQRIISRGSNHRSLTPQNPRLAEILGGTCKGFEPPAFDELQKFDAVLDVNINKSVQASLSKLLRELGNRGWLSSGHPSRVQDAAKEAVESAVREAKHFEASLLSHCGSGGTIIPAPTHPMVLARQTATGDQLPLYWGIFFGDDDASHSILGRLCSAIPADFKDVADKHVTLLYIGGGSHEESAARRLGLALQEFNRLRQACERLSGHRVKVTFQQIVRDADIVCAGVELHGDVICANEYPHVTLAHSSRVGPVYSNTLLRKAHSGELGAGSDVQSLGVPAPCLYGTVAPWWGAPRSGKL